jgi:long-subunit acyl-CoA synthetase (AMP-forming)
MDNAIYDARAVAQEKVDRIKSWEDKKIKYRDIRPITDLRDMFFSSAEIFADRIAFYVKDSNLAKYRGITYKEAQRDVEALGTALLELGLQGKRIAIIGENRYEWAVTYLAAVCSDILVVPLDKELPYDEIKYLIENAQVDCVVFSNKYEKLFVEAMGKEKSTLKILINMDTTENEEKVMSFSKVVSQGLSTIKAGSKIFKNIKIDRESMKILLYTSGTTGLAKGVMLSHNNITENLMVMGTLVLILPEDVFFSVLPIHHTYECTCGFLLPLYKGSAIAYCEGLKYIVKNLEEVKPTVFLGVPLIFESIYKRIWAQAKKAGSAEKLKKVIKINEKTKKIGLDLAPLLLKKVTSVFGGRMRLMIAGGAAIDPEVLKGLKAFGINAIQGYGLTECSPIVAINPDFDPRDDAAGYPPPFIAIKINDVNEDGIGEIIAKGNNIMLGYYQNQQATDEVIKDGWFYTGDLGYIDTQGYVHITGRKKNVIITKNGKNVFPEELELYAGKMPFVEECMAWAKEGQDGEDVIINLSIKPKYDELKDAYPNGISDQEIYKLFWAEVDEINNDLPFYKRIKKIDIRKEEFEKTTGKKIKRFSASNKIG